MKIPGFRGARLERVARLLVKELSRNAVTDSAALLSYYLLFAIFPFFFFLITLAAYLPLQGPTQSAVADLQAVMPAQAYRIVSQHIEYLVSHRQPHLLTITLLGAIWSASRAVDSFRKSMNLAYDVQESRSALKTNAIALVTTVLSAALCLVAMAMLAAGGRLGGWLATRLGVAGFYQQVWSWLRWPVTALVVMLVTAVGFYALPDVEQRFKYITPGSAISTVLWLVATWAFGVYADHSGSYNAVYGSLGGLIAMLTWLYVSGLIFIAGGEINAVLEDQSVDGKALGSRRPRERPPPRSQRPSAASPGATKSAKVAQTDLAANREAPHPPHH